MADAITKDLDELHKQARSARRLFEPDWFMNLSYFQGRQWVRWNGNQLHIPQLAPNRITVVENRIVGIVRTELAKMTKNRPVFVVTPRTGDEEDANAAKLAEQVMRFLWEHLKLHESTYKALEWSRITGAGFLKAYWDPTIGDPVNVMVGPDGQVIQDAQGKPMKGDQGMALALTQSLGSQVQAKQVAAGDIRVEVRSSFQMFIDPLADSFTEAEWVIEESVKSRQYVRQRFNIDLKPDTPANPGLVEARLMGALGSGTNAYKGIKVREYWCKPNRDHPRGCRIVWAQGKVLLQDEKPYDPMPYIMLSGIPVPGRLWPMSPIDPLRAPQTELNKVRSQMAENRNRVGNPTLLASKQAVQDPDKFLDSTSVPGGVYFYDDIGSPNALPKYLEAPPLPDYVAEEPQVIRQAMEDISGQHEVTNAQVPPGVTAASAITLLQEADDTRLGPAITDYELQLGRLGQKLLKLVSTYYTDARTVKIGGDNGAWEIFDFRGAMMRDNTHVEVQAGSAFPQSKAAKQALIQDLMTFFVQSGNPPHGRQLAQFLRDSGMGGTDRLVEEFTLDEQQVNRENVLLGLGQPLQINEYDNDQAHIDGHTDFQKQTRYTQLPPQVQQIFEMHVQQHRQRLAEQQQAQMQLQMQMQGTPSPEDQQQQMQMQQAQQQQQMQNQQQQAQMQQAQQAQQMDMRGDQQAQEQAMSQQDAAQQRQHAEQAHQQKLQHLEELHQAKLHQMQQQARMQAQQQRSQGANNRGKS